MIEYVNNVLPDFPKKEVVLKQNIERNQYELIETIYAYIINDNKRIKEKYMKEFLIKLSMCNYYMEISYHRKYINSHKLKCISKMFIELRKLAYGIIRGMQDVLSKND